MTNKYATALNDFIATMRRNPHYGGAGGIKLQTINAIKEALLERQWQDIESAPDGVVVLTNCGSAMKSYNQWLLCNADGEVPCCASYGTEHAEVNPTHYRPFPIPT